MSIRVTVSMELFKSLKHHPKSSGMWLLLGIMLCTGSLSNSSKPPHVMFIVVDDLRPFLSTYHPSENIVTPNIDDLAKHSIQFNNAYAQQAYCAPSRNSMLTSRRPDSTHLYDTHSYWREVAGNYTTLPQFFKERGYLAASFGKVFHPGKSSNHTDDFPYSWSLLPYHPPSQIYKNAKVCHNADGSLSANIVCPVDLASQPTGTLPDIETVSTASAFIQSYLASNLTTPLFLAVGLHKPHIPLKFPKEYLDLYPLATVTPTRNPNRPVGLPDIGWNPWTDVRQREDIEKLNLTFPYGEIPDNYSLLIRQSYLAATSYMDDMVGMLLDSLDAAGMMDDTVIVLLGDHGWSLGEHGEWSKYSLYQTATRVPLLMYIPNLTARRTGKWRRKGQHAIHCPFHPNQMVERKLRRIQRVRSGKKKHMNSQKLVTDKLIELVDIFPTLVDVAELQPSLPTCKDGQHQEQICTEGSSFYSLIKAIAQNETLPEWKNAVFTQYPRPSVEPQRNSDKPNLIDIKYMGYSVRSKSQGEGYRYVEWATFNTTSFTPNWNEVVSKELYDLNIDPHENSNVINMEEYRDVIKMLSKALHMGWRAALP